jgi:hypothetical protein
VSGQQLRTLGGEPFAAAVTTAVARGLLRLWREQEGPIISLDEGVARTNFPPPPAAGRQTRERWAGPPDVGLLLPMRLARSRAGASRRARQARPSYARMQAALLTGAGMPQPREGRAWYRSRALPAACSWSECLTT